MPATYEVRPILWQPPVGEPVVDRRLAPGKTQPTRTLTPKPATLTDCRGCNIESGQVALMQPDQLDNYEGQFRPTTWNGDEIVYGHMGEKGPAFRVTAWPESELAGPVAEPPRQRPRPRR
jgi:hypothetical protein